MEVPLNWELSLSWTLFPMNLDIEPLTGTSEGNRLSRLHGPSTVCWQYIWKVDHVNHNYSVMPCTARNRVEKMLIQMKQNIAWQKEAPRYSKVWFWVALMRRWCIERLMEKWNSECYLCLVQVGLGNLGLSCCLENDLQTNKFYKNFIQMSRQ